MRKDSDDEIDGCDVPMDEATATSDEDLPVAEGGVAAEENEDDIEGCDVPIRDQDATPDEELPIADGGID